MRTFADALRDARTRRGWSQHRLALEAEVDHASIARLESRQRHPSARMVHRLADALATDAATRARLLVAAGFWPGEYGAALVVGPLLGAWR